MTTDTGKKDPADCNNKDVDFTTWLGTLESLLGATVANTRYLYDAGHTPREIVEWMGRAKIIT